MNEINNALKKADFFKIEDIKLPILGENIIYYRCCRHWKDNKNIENNFIPIILTTQPKRYFPWKLQIIKTDTRKKFESYKKIWIILYLLKTKKCVTKIFQKYPWNVGPDDFTSMLNKTLREEIV